MNAEITLQTLRDRRRFMSWWALGLFAFVLLQIVFYPSIRDASGLNDYAKNMSDTMRALFVGGETDLTSAAGYLNSQIFAFAAPLLLLILGVGLGGGLIAGDEERGTLDYLLAQPLTRTSVLLQRLGALIICIAAGALVVELSVAIGGPVFDLTLSVGKMTAATISCALLAILFGVLALAIGAIAPGKGRAIGLAGALAVGAWVLDGLGQAVDSLEPLRPLSPFYQALGHSPLREGPPWGGWVLLCAATIACAAAAVYGINRRDIRG